MKITTDPDDNPTEGEDHGVLPEAGLDTTAIGIMGPSTAQVRVVLPQVLEEPDDEVVDDEIEPGDLRSGGIVIELPAEEIAEAGEAVARAREAGEEPALTGEIVEDVVDAVREHLAESEDAPAEGDVIDVVVVPEQSVRSEPVPGESAAEERDGDESDAAADEDLAGELDTAHDRPIVEGAFVEDEPPRTEPVADADEVVVEEESLDAETADAQATAQRIDDGYVEEEPVATERGELGESDASADEVQEAGDEGPHAFDGPRPPVDGWRAAAAELAAEHAVRPAPARAEADDSAPRGEDPAHDEPAKDAPAEDERAEGAPAEDDSTPSADKARSYARIWAEESASQRVAVATEPDPHTQKTSGAITMSARRLEDLGKNAERESSDLLTADRVLNPHRVGKAAPEGAWSEFVYGLTGGRINLGDSRKVRTRKALEARVAAPLSGETRFVPVLSRKGGVGKTTITTLLGMALADGREDRVIAIDANPDRGTLADRIGKRTDKTVRDLVHRAGEIRGFNDISRFVARDETRLDVLASDPDPRIAEAFGEDDYRRVADVAEHFYSLVLTDTGTGIIHSVMSATLAHADQLIIVTGLNLDEVRLASETITWLESNGYEQLARDAIVVLNQQSEGAPMVRLSELEVHFGSRVRSVVHLPYDRALATGSAIVYRDLRPETREAARDLAARVVDGLREGRSA